MDRPTTHTTDGSSSRHRLLHPEHPVRRLVSAAITCGVVALTLWFWPATLGGSARVVVVSGTSMEPVFDLGDIVITRDDDQHSIGDIALFRLTEGAGAGQLIIHRIIGVRDDGTFIMQGDNRDEPDRFHVGYDDVVGEPVLHIPYAGIAVRMMQQIWVLALVVGVITTMLLWPSRSDDEDDEWEHADDPTVALPRVDPVLGVDLDQLAREAQWRAEAEAWLAEQLAADQR
jgi:signal peptidase I